MGTIAKLLCNWKWNFGITHLECIKLFFNKKSSHLYQKFWWSRVYVTGKENLENMAIFLKILVNLPSFFAHWHFKNFHISWIDLFTVTCTQSCSNCTPYPQKQEKLPICCIHWCQIGQQHECQIIWSSYEAVISPNLKGICYILQLSPTILTQCSKFVNTQTKSIFPIQFTEIQFVVCVIRIGNA